MNIDENVVLDLIARNLHVRRESLALDLSFREELRVDSFQLVETALLIEEVTGVVLPDRALFEVHTIRDLLEVLSKSVPSAERV